VRLGDRRYLFGLTPWAYFPLWLAVLLGLSWILDEAPLWLRLVVIAPISWTLVIYILRMPNFARSTARGRRPEGGSAER
jgi:hypothetical protein